MIFPDLPRPYQLNQGLDASAIEQAQAPLHSIDSIEPTTKITADEWFAKYNKHTDPAAQVYVHRVKEPIDWFARDAGEFYVLSVGMIVWVIYWRQFV